MLNDFKESWTKRRRFGRHYLLIYIPLVSRNIVMDLMRTASEVIDTLGQESVESLNSTRNLFFI
jgi:hypothetical protein